MSEQLIGLDGQPIQTPQMARAPHFDDERAHADEIFSRLGELDGMFLFNDILVAQYIRKTVSEHLVASSDTQRSDYYEGVVGLVLTIGPAAFQDDTVTKFPWDAWIRAGLTSKPGIPPIKKGDWVLYRATDGWNKDIQMTGEYNVLHCRVLQDAHIRGIVKYPGRWW